MERPAMSFQLCFAVRPARSNLHNSNYGILWAKLVLQIIYKRIMDSMCMFPFEPLGVGVAARYERSETEHEGKFKTDS